MEIYVTSKGLAFRTDRPVNYYGEYYYESFVTLPDGYFADEIGARGTIMATTTTTTTTTKPAVTSPGLPAWASYVDGVLLMWLQGEPFVLTSAAGNCN
jgi:hypothetical protein